MRNSYVVTIVTLMAGIAIGYLLRGFLQPAPTAPLPMTTSSTQTTPSPAAMTQSLSRSDIAELTANADGGVSVGSDRTRPVIANTNLVGNGQVNSEMFARLRQRAVDTERAGLQDFFDLYGIPDERADAIVNELSARRREIRQRVYAEQQAAGVTVFDGTLADDEIDQLEREVFGEYYDGYQEYKPKQYAHQAVSQFSSQLAQPLDFTVRTQISDIVYSARLRQQANSAPPTSVTTNAGVGLTLEQMQYQQQQAQERHDDILGQTERILTREQQQAFVDHLARQREMNELGMRMMELRNQQRNR
ncbi:MAG: hypothetical protein AAAFM81_01820 [Pseudomonadota bacterium]